MDIWMDVDAAITVPVNILPLLDDADFKSIETGVVYNAPGLELIWNFVTTAGVQTHTAITPTDTGGSYDWVIIGHGMYNIELPASVNNAEGFGWFTGVATGVLPWRGPVIGFRASGLNDLLIDSAYSVTRGLTGTAVPAAAADGAGGLPISDGGGLDMDALKADAAATKVKTDFLPDEAPSTLDEVADAVHDEMLSGHLVDGSAGKALADAGTAGDPWNTNLPGGYSAGKAGRILDDIKKLADELLAELPFVG